MSILSGSAIRLAVAQGKIVITPWRGDLVNANSVDLHIGNTLVCYRNRSQYNTETRRSESIDRLGVTAPQNAPGGCALYFAIDSIDPPEVEEVPLVELPTEESNVGRRMAWLLVPGVLYLGYTLEYTETHGYQPKIDGRSSTGRVGVFTHITAGFGDNGFCGHWTLELTCVEPVLIYPGQRLIQISYSTIKGNPLVYGDTDNSSGRYNRQKAYPVPTRKGAFSS